MATRKKPKQFYYVCVVTKDNKFAFVTKIDTDKKTAEWTMNKGDKPLTIYSWEDANYIALGLQVHGTWAFPVVNSYELDTLPYFQVHGTWAFPVVNSYELDTLPYFAKES